MNKIVNLDNACLAARNEFLASVKEAMEILTHEFEKHGSISRTRGFHLSKTPPGSYDVIGSVEYKDKLATHELKLDAEFHHDGTVSITMVLFKKTDERYVTTPELSYVKIKGGADDLLGSFVTHVPDYVSLVETGKVPASIKKVIEKYR
ncbi:MAG: hypothetical protein KBC98_00765 [Candidatus Pacebacteria bacterium]|nr:hypothetical protein [Candidatus Paceibacterota bacterium]